LQKRILPRHSSQQQNNNCIGNPDATKDKYWHLRKTVYRLRRSSRQWYTKTNSVLNQLGLKSNLSDPYLFMGNIVDPSPPENPPSTLPITLGLYVNDFVYFSKALPLNNILNVFSAN
jgi:hypothetical protein